MKCSIEVDSRPSVCYIELHPWACSKLPVDSKLLGLTMMPNASMVLLLPSAFILKQKNVGARATQRKRAKGMGIYAAWLRQGSDSDIVGNLRERRSIKQHWHPRNR